ncbi:hypothetical protein CHARACLAT_019851, partial [Characodon lateralis]|nr:hypothetical protein [Characodon lateralis]
LIPYVVQENKHNRDKKSRQMAIQILNHSSSVQILIRIIHILSSQKFKRNQSPGSSMCHMQHPVQRPNRQKSKRFNNRGIDLQSLCRKKAVSNELQRDNDLKW